MGVEIDACQQDDALSGLSAGKGSQGRRDHVQLAPAPPPTEKGLLYTPAPNTFLI